MTCINKGWAIVCVSTFYRLPLADGSRIFMDWHNYLGPTFFHDRNANRQVEDWWENKLICNALDWFQGRGKRA